MRLSENEIQDILSKEIPKWKYDGKYIIRDIETKKFQRNHDGDKSYSWDIGSTFSSSGY
jgi:hypothetical protein